MQRQQIWMRTQIVQNQSTRISNKMPNMLLLYIWTQLKQPKQIRCKPIFAFGLQIHRVAKCEAKLNNDDSFPEAPSALTQRRSPVGFFIKNSTVYVSFREHTIRSEVHFCNLRFYLCQWIFKTGTMCNKFFTTCFLFQNSIIDFIAQQNYSFF